MAVIINKILTQQYQPALREIILATTVFEATEDISAPQISYMLLTCSALFGPAGT